MTDDTDIHSKGAHGQNRIIEGLPLVDRTGSGIKVNHAHPQSQFCHFKGFVGPSRVFKEEIGSIVGPIVVNLDLALFKLNAPFDKPQHFLIGEGFHSYQMFE